MTHISVSPEDAQFCSATLRLSFAPKSSEISRYLLAFITKIARNLIAAKQGLFRLNGYT